MNGLSLLAVAATVLVGIVLVPAGVGAHEGHDASPHPTPSAGSSPAPAAAPAPVTFRIRADARADLGWTGIAHAQPWPAEQHLGFAADCSAGGADCRAVGGSAGDFFGSPVGLSSGGVPVCVVNRLTGPVGGSVQPKTGCGALELHLQSTIYLAEDVAGPCPVCVEDPKPNDGKKEGRCRGGAANERACDTHGVSSLFGATSNDCLPSAGKNVGELPIDLAPLTTGHASLSAKLVCKARSGKDAPRCHCAAQTEAEACTGSPCSPDGRCVDGPIDGICSRAPYRSCRLDSGPAECDALFPGSGECVTSVRPCFNSTIEATGRCDPEHPTYVAVFCTGATRAPTLNAVAGLPGPARLVLPLERLR